MKSNDPTPSEIAARSKEIRDEWTPEQRARARASVIALETDAADGYRWREPKRRRSG